jgi:hypothetical protein
MGTVMASPNQDPTPRKTIAGSQQELAARPGMAEIDRQLRQAKGHVSRAEQELADSRRGEEFWQALSRDLAADRPAGVLLTLRESGDYILRLQQVDAAAARSLEELRIASVARAKEAADTFGRVFPEKVRQQEFSRSFPIDPSSRHPHYTFGHSFLRVDIDERQHMAVITPRDGDELVIGLDVDHVVETIGEQFRRLFMRQPDLDALLRSLYTAYVAVLRAENRPEGEAVPLRRVSNRLAKNVNRFAADEFNVDLARLVREGRVETDGKRLHVSHTRNARQGMLLHNLEEGGYVGFISFKHE